MISYKEAIETVFNNTLDFKVIDVDIEKSQGYVLAKPIKADRDFPPYDRVCMDGIAIDYRSFQKGQRSFKAEKLQSAGDEQSQLLDQDNCIEVMTGSVLPVGTSTVIPYESTNTSNGSFTVTEDIEDNKNIHYKGSDALRNDILLDRNCIISPAEIAVLATVGIRNVNVIKPPSVAIISTGDELVDVEATPLPHQIRKSNVFSIQAQLKKYKINADLYHLDDDYDLLNQELKKIIENYDVMILSGGVSKGKKDFIPEILEKLGTTKLFHRVRQRPGKPFWFGKRDSTVIFAFPGNPVSTMVCAMAYLIPWLRKCSGLEPQGDWRTVRLLEDVMFKPDLTYFAPAKITYDSTTLCCKVIKGNGSGDISNLLHVDGFIILPQGQDLYKKDHLFNFISFRQEL